MQEYLATFKIIADIGFPIVVAIILLFDKIRYQPKLIASLEHLKEQVQDVHDLCINFRYHPKLISSVDDLTTEIYDMKNTINNNRSRPS